MKILSARFQTPVSVGFKAVNACHADRDGISTMTFEGGLLLITHPAGVTAVPAGNVASMAVDVGVSKKK